MSKSINKIETGINTENGIIDYSRKEESIGERKYQKRHSTEETQLRSREGWLEFHLGKIKERESGRVGKNYSNQEG